MTSRRGRPRFLVAVLLLAALTLITLSTRGSGNGALRSVRNGFHSVLTPVDDAVHTVLRPVGDFITGAVHYGSLRAENERLRQQLAANQATAAENQYLQAQDGQILQANGIRWAGSYRKVVAKVVAQPDSNFETTITIDKGSAQGVAPDQTVVAPGGLVGQVTSVTSSSSVVTLLTDPAVTEGVALPSGNVGSATGFGEGALLRVQVLSTGRTPPQVTKGAVVFTSGTDSFPQGIPVGRVASAPVVPGALEPSISLRPLADLDDLDYVDVLLWSPQQ